ncbi:hypothetical protein [Catellatospora chokoriensis]|uniref:hypothetical protein n=1 Tax=Catellatospora chokoriensis TaxID=310353 RepID=UPI001783DEFF|nr:hypothetical protein [Catellatospora chokoriensis]
MAEQQHIVFNLVAFDAGEHQVADHEGANDTSSDPKPAITSEDSASAKFGWSTNQLAEARGPAAS